MMPAKSPRRRCATTRPSAFGTDVRRTITDNPKRFISLFIITALGATMLVGLKAACDDLRATADSFYDAQSLFDVSVRSTLGLDESDIDALAGVEGVRDAEGGYAETAYTQVDGQRQKVDVRALLSTGINEPMLLEGRLPRDVDEVAVTQKYLDATGKRIGDVVEFESTAAGEGTSEASGEGIAAADEPEADARPIFADGAYTITASVLDPMDVNAGSKTMGFRSGSGPKYAFFLTPGAVLDRATFTVAYVTLAGAAELPTYSQEYKDLVFAAKERIELIRDEREQARAASVRADAGARIDERQAEADEQMEQATSKLADAQGQVDDALALVESGARELAAQGADADRQLADAAAKLDAAQAQIDAGLSVIEAKQVELDAGRAEVNAGMEQIEAAESSAGQLAKLMGDEWPAEAWARLQAGDASARAPFVAALEAYAAKAAPQLDEAIALADSIDALLAKLPTDPGVQQELIQKINRMAALLKVLYPDHADDIERVRDIVANHVGDAEAIASAREAIARIREALVGLRDQVAGLGGAAAQLADAVLAKPALAAALAKIESGQRQLNAARAEAHRGQGRLDAGREQLEVQRAAAEDQLAGARRELADGAARAASGQADIDAGRAELEKSASDANAAFADARRELDDIDRATWYIQDRSSLPSYASVESDASSIESIATVFPLIFFTVAVLISLTTVTRMVEEDRGLIGVYKALGYGRGRILSKYLVYSFSACLLGGIAGDALGFIALPEILFTIFRTMYALPAFRLGFDAFSAFWGIALFAIGIVGATVVACAQVLRETPASLMRPRAPRAGKRILLERIAPLWHRMGFLNKVSARNLFRYKKRALMTIFGIAGCTALMICGLGIRDTVISLKPRQYGDEGVVRYDLMALTTEDGFADGERELRASGMVDEMLEARIDTATAEFGGAKESVQLVVVPRDADLSAYLKTDDAAGTTPLAPARGGDPLSLPTDGESILITKNAEQVLGFSVGDEVELQDSALRTAKVRVEGVTINYLGNFAFMTEDAYVRAFGRKVVPNAMLVNLEGTDAEKIALADELAADDAFVTVSSATRIANDFSESFKIIDVVVYVVTVMAGALAFAVVFTLSNTNISERERELATIKVLGFRCREVYRYINKETIVLTLVGIVAGWPLGYAITRFLTYVLRMPSLFFDTIVEWPTYVFASLASIAFTLVINRMTNRSLDRIDMVGALKSAE